MRRPLVFVLLPLALLLVGTACASQHSVQPSANFPTAVEPVVTNSVPAIPDLALTVPDVVGLKLTDAIDQLDGLGILWRRVFKVTSVRPPGTVLSQSPAATTDVDPGTTITLVVAKAPARPKPKPTPTQTHTPPPSNCDPAYPDVGRVRASGV